MTVWGKWRAAPGKNDDFKEWRIEFRDWRCQSTKSTSRPEWGQKRMRHTVPSSQSSDLKKNILRNKWRSEIRNWLWKWARVWHQGTKEFDCECFPFPIPCFARVLESYSPENESLMIQFVFHNIDSDMALATGDRFQWAKYQPREKILPDSIAVRTAGSVLALPS